MTSQRPASATRRIRRDGRPARELNSVLRADMDARHGALEIAAHYWAAVYRERRGVANPRATEPVHRMRVANRRLRMAIRHYGDLLPDDFLEAVDPELKRLNRLLAPVRDTDVQIEMLRSIRRGRHPKRYVAFIEAMEAHVKEINREARDELTAAIDTGFLDEIGRRMRDTLREVRRAEATVGVDVVGYARPAMAEAAWRLLSQGARRVRKRYKRARKDGSPESLHRLRREVRRLRYGLEAVRPLGGRRLDKPIGRLVDFQDVLGDHQDHQVGLQQVEDYRKRLQRRGGPTPEEAAGLGRLSAAFHESSKAFRRQLTSKWRRLGPMLKKKALRDVLPGM